MPDSRSVTLVWFRLDLRLADNPALEAAIASRPAVLPVFIWAPEEDGRWAPGEASCWWLHQSLLSLQAELLKRGSNLIIRRGPAADALQALAAETGARSIFWNRRYEPASVTRDRELNSTLRERGFTVHSYPGNLLFEPWTIHNSAGNPFQVFTAFWKACLAAPAPPAPKAAPNAIPAPDTWPESLAIADLGLEPRIDWTAGLRETWRPGEAGAQLQMRDFLSRSVEAYANERDRPDHIGTSRLSPHLHFGEVSVRQIWHAAERPAADPYLRQIAWREFAHHLLFHYPQTPVEPLRPQFRGFPWRMHDAHLEAHLKVWTRGQTGYPLVDAGMRELWRTGWMHNRVRMVAASFLVKHLLIPWQEGAAWFWDTLVDADLANNTLGWQWVAGCGADAAPYFRIFNPVIQGQKFDPDGQYIRTWIPELGRLPSEWIHQPWKAPEAQLRAAGVELGKDYPRPVVEHEAARRRALAALQSMHT